MRAGPTHDEVHHVENDVLVLGFIGPEVIQGGEDFTSWSTGRQCLFHDDAQAHHLPLLEYDAQVEVMRQLAEGVAPHL